MTDFEEERLIDATKSIPGEKYFNTFEREIGYGVKVHRGGKVVRIGSDQALFEQNRNLLEVHDPEKVADLVSSLGVFMRNSILTTHSDAEAGRKNAWLARNTPMTIWNNATSDDFKHPENFLTRLTSEFEDLTFEQMTEWKPLLASNTLGVDVYVRRAVPLWEYESPNEIQVGLTSYKRTPLDEEMFHSVRYGRPSKEEIVVYAIQMPLLEGTTARVLERDTSGAVEHLRKAADFLKTEYGANHVIFRKVLGEIPVDILDIEDPEQFTMAYIGYLKDRAGQEGEDSLYGWAYEHRYRESKSGLNRLLPTAQNADWWSMVHYNLKEIEEQVEILKKRPAYEELYQKIEKRGKLQIQANTAFAGGVPKQLREAPPAALLSTAIFVSLMHREGVRRLVVPLEFPLRGHPDEQGIDKKLRKQKTKIIERLAHEINGFNVVSLGEESSEKPDYLVVALDEELTSNRPVLQEVLKSHL